MLLSGGTCAVGTEGVGQGALAQDDIWRKLMEIDIKTQSCFRQSCFRLHDLDQLQEWEQDWQLLHVFNPDKCEHIRITNKCKIIQT